MTKEGRRKRSFCLHNSLKKTHRGKVTCRLFWSLSLIPAMPLTFCNNEYSSVFSQRDTIPQRIQPGGIHTKETDWLTVVHVLHLLATLIPTRYLLYSIQSDPLSLGGTLPVCPHAIFILAPTVSLLRLIYTDNPNMRPASAQWRRLERSKWKKG